MEVFLACFSTVSLPDVCAIIKDAKCACAHLRLLAGILMTPPLTQQKPSEEEGRWRVSEQKYGRYACKLVGEKTKIKIKDYAERKKTSAMKQQQKQNMNADNHV